MFKKGFGQGYGQTAKIQYNSQNYLNFLQLLDNANYLTYIATTHKTQSHMV